MSAVLVLYAVSVMDGHSIILEKWNNVQNDLKMQTLAIKNVQNEKQYD